MEWSARGHLATLTHAYDAFVCIQVVPLLQCKEILIVSAADGGPETLLGDGQRVVGHVLIAVVKVEKILSLWTACTHAHAKLL
jgi:hypothetical protein